MLDIKFLEENTELAKANLAKRGVDLSFVDQVIALNDKRKALVQSTESTRAQVKQLSKEIGNLKKQGQNADAQMKQVSDLKKSIEEDADSLTQFEEQRDQLLLSLPNLISDETPLGKSEDDNVEIIRKGKIPQFDFQPKEHHELGERLGMLDFERGVKLAGSRFVVYKGLLARLERALINFMLDEHTANGYEECIPPFIVNKETMTGTGQLPKFEEDLFKLQGRDWYLIPTSEVPLTNLKRDELFPSEELPLKYTAYTPCFRSEAGSYGKDTKGLIRVHQFNKVELVNIVTARESNNAHQDMVERASSILDQLELPYRGMLLCSADIGFSAQKTIDLEVWLPGQNTYREISSISNCGDFQGRRAKIRYRGEDGKPEFAHTLNGSGLAVGRTVVAILENYQNADGSITVPKVLRPYMGGIDSISCQN